MKSQSRSFKSINTERRIEILSWIGLKLGNDFLVDLLQKSLMIDRDFAQLIMYRVGEILMSYLTLTAIMHNREATSQEYQNIRNLYNQLLQKSRDLFVMMNLENPVHILSVHSHMLNKGYWSNDKQFFCGSRHLKDLCKFNDADIINGYGVCRNIASKLVKTNRAMGLESYGLSVFTTSKTIGLAEKLCTEDRKYLSDSLIEKIMTFITDIFQIPNHEITVTAYNGKTYILDATHDCALKVTSGRNLTLLNDEKGKMRLSYLSTAFVTSIKEAKRVSQLLKQETISNEEFRQWYAEGTQKYWANQEAIETFYRENAELYKEIANEMAKFPNLVHRVISF